MCEPNLRQSALLSATLALAVVASAAAAVGWRRTPNHVERPARSIRIVDVRPLRISDPNLRDLITHNFAVRVAISGWTLLPYQPGSTASDNRLDAGHWRLYLDGGSLGDNFCYRKRRRETVSSPSVWSADQRSLFFGVTSEG